MDLFNSWLVHNYVAHRGLHDDKNPENSLGAFKKAVEKGYTIEFDLHPLADGTPVVFHDDTLKRMTNEDGYIKNIKDVKALKKLKLNGGDETIPTLEEALNLIAGKTPIIIEFKDFNSSPDTTFLKRVYEMLKTYNGDYAIMSFNPFILKWFKQNAPEVIRGQLASFFNDLDMGRIKKFALKRMLLNKHISEPQFIAYKWDEVPNRFVKKFKNLPLLVWAVPSQQAYMKVVSHCDNIIFENFEPRI